MTATLTTLPIGFDLRNAEEQQVLYITDQITGQVLHFELHNQLKAGGLSLNAIKPEEASIENCHFQLVFRPDTLLEGKPAIDVLEADKYGLLKTSGNKVLHQNVDGTQSLYLFAKKDMELQPGEKLTVGLQHLRADRREGTHNTRVMLKYRGFDSLGQQLPEGYRAIQLAVVNHWGKRNIPLHVGFIGDNRVLNDGETENSLKLRLTNTAGRQGVAIAGIDASGEDIGFTEKSRVFLSFDIEADPLSETSGIQKKWALCFAAQTSEITVQARVQSDPALQLDVELVPGSVQANRIVWEIKGVDSNGQTILNKLSPWQNIEISLNGIKSNHPNGITHVHLHYVNITGYWDGRFSVQIEKGPVRFRETLTGKRVEVVNASVDVMSDEAQSNADKEGALSREGTKADLILTRRGSSEASLNGYPAPLIDFRASGQAGEWTGEWSVAQVLGISQMAGGIYSGGIAFLTSPGGDDHSIPNLRKFGAAPVTRMVIDGDGHVGVGTSKPKKLLHIQGTNKFDKDIPIFEDEQDRPGLSITGQYPQIDLFSNATNNNHGATIRLGAYDDDDESNYKHWVIGTAGRNASSLDIGFARNQENPHAGIKNHKGTTVLHVTKDGLEVTGQDESPKTVKTITADRFVGEGIAVAGMIMMWYGALNQVPKGWVLCNGAKIEVEGPYKGQNAPDLREKFVLGSVDVNKIKKTGGNEKGEVRLTLKELPIHTHEVQSTSGDRGFGSGGMKAPHDAKKRVKDRDAFWQVAGDTSFIVYGDPIVPQLTGEGKPFSIMPPYLALAYIMKV